VEGSKIKGEKAATPKNHEILSTKYEEKINVK
jgi:hypothetical protein